MTTSRHWLSDIVMMRAHANSLEGTMLERISSIFQKLIGSLEGESLSGFMISQDPKLT